MVGEIFVLIGQIVFIACLETIIDSLLTPDKNIARLINVACFAGALYLVLNFVFNSLLQEIVTALQFAF
ncbi:MAG: hypothetical protein LBS62_12285 [Clostridiales bacterium]|jgi:hypothetical protein|nr:hypothetical protein [Clostridiales bacterium]